MKDPWLLTHEDAIRYFLNTLGPQLEAAGQVQNVIDRFVEFYKNTRIVGADLDQDTDDFCIESGAYWKITSPKPDDFRGKGDSCFGSDDKRYLQVSVRRTVHPIGVLELYSQFDDDAFEMCFNMYFEPTEENCPSVYVECQTPETLGPELLLANEREPLKSLLSRTPLSTFYFVGGAG
ncbi:MAG: hypothetical protein ACRC8S_05875 [Fimbriiglobus sp.]